MSGDSSCCRASRKISAYERLLMSSDVHAKWKNSRLALRRWTDAESAEVAAAAASLRKYSTALTSWFVVASISLTRRAPSSPPHSISFSWGRPTLRKKS